MNAKAVASLFFALLFLAAAETGLRMLDPGKGSRTVSYTTRRPVIVNLGTSRTFRGLSPEEIADVVEGAGMERPFVANIFERAATNVGLLMIYMETVRPWAARTDRPGIVAIETRGSAMNDSYLLRDEEAWLAERRRVAPSSRNEPSGFLLSLRAGRFDLASRIALRKVRFTRGYRYVKRMAARRRRAGHRQEEVAPLETYLETFSWGRKPYGWKPFNVAAADLRVDECREMYAGKLLKNYRVGGIQADALVELVRAVKEDGWTPALYLMPLTGLHRTFYKEGEYDLFLDRVRRISEEEGVVAVDLDRERTFTDSDFRDTHHLREKGSIKVSRRFAHRLVLPLLRSRP